MPKCKSFRITEVERNHVRRRARFQQRRELSSSFFQQSKALEEIHALLTETLGEYAQFSATVENVVAQFKRGYFPPVMRLVLDDRKRDYLGDYTEKNIYLGPRTSIGEHNSTFLLNSYMYTEFFFEAVSKIRKTICANRTLRTNESSKICHQNVQAHVFLL